MLTNLINNIAFLIGLVAAVQLVVARFQKSPMNRQLLLGILFGSVTLLGMANPVDFAPGIIFDGRSIVLSVAGVVGGGWVAAVAAGMAAIYRFELGGSGAMVGILVIASSALLGVLFGGGGGRNGSMQTRSRPSSRGTSRGIWSLTELPACRSGYHRAPTAEARLR